MLPALIILISFKATFSADESATQNCLLSYPNIKLDCAEPFRRQLVESKNVCKSICTRSHQRVLSCQYDERSSLCELLNVVAPLDHFKSAASSLLGKHDAKAHDSGKKVQSSQSDSIQNISVCEPSLIPSIGNTLFVVDVKCISDFAEMETSASDITNFVKILKPSNVHYSAAKLVTALQPVMKTSSSRDLVNLTQFGTIKKPFHSIMKGIKNTKISDCLPGFTMRFEIIQGIELQSKALISFKADSPNICLYACKNNHANGTRFQTSCRSAQYDRRLERCFFFDNSITPTGSAQYEPNEDIVYFEKICLPDSIARNCDGALRRVPQYLLIGHATAIVDAQTHSSCVEMCMRSMEEFGFYCRSAIHFYEYPGLNCILNAHSARTRPNFFSAELKQKVDYVEMNDCQRQRNQEALIDQKHLEGFIKMTEKSPSSEHDSCMFWKFMQFCIHCNRIQLFFSECGKMIPDNNKKF